MGGEVAWHSLYMSLPHCMITKDAYLKHLAEMNEKAKLLIIIAQQAILFARLTNCLRAATLTRS